MSAHGRIPFSGLDVFPFGTFLQVQVSFGIEDVQMDDRMKQFAAAVAFPAGGGSGDISLFIDDGEHFLVIIA